MLTFVIKNNDEERLVSEKVNENFQIQPVDAKVLDAQSKISIDRENRLRDLSTTPKEIKQIDTTTTTATTTTVEEKKASSSKSDSSTKSS